MKKNILIIALLGFVFCGALYAQPEPASIFDKINYGFKGRPFPDFVLNNVEYYPKKQITLNDLKGKHTILYFWGNSCEECCKVAFPIINQYQQQYKDKLQIIMIGGGINSPYLKDIKTIFEEQREEQDLKLSIIYDTSLFKRLGLLHWPDEVWIDDKGVIQAEGEGSNLGSGPDILNAGNIAAFLEGRPIEKSNEKDTTTYSSKNVPVIGQPCPDYILQGVQEYPQKQVSLQDLKGKFTILDFWAKGCSVCIESFPKLNRLQQQFKDKLQIMLIGLYFNNSGKHAKKEIENIYETYRKKLQLQLSFVFDSTIYQTWKINSVPYEVWIDDKGVVKAVTYADEVTEENIIAFLGGRPFSFKDQSYQMRQQIKNNFDRSNPYLVNGNGGDDNDFIFRSILSVWHEDQPFVPNSNISWGIQIIKSGAVLRDFQTMGAYLVNLYETAYFGARPGPGNDSVWTGMPIVEVKDTATYNLLVSHQYNYSMRVPDIHLNKAYMERIMQQNLENYFGYKGVIEYRDMPCLKLVAVNRKEAEKKLKSKGGAEKINYTGPSGLSVTNSPLKTIARYLGYNNYISLELGGIIDSTGITDNVDFTIDNVTMNDWQEIRKAIQKYGLDLVPTTRRVKTPVITDADASTTN